MNAHVYDFHAHNAVRYTYLAQFLVHSRAYYIAFAIGALESMRKELEGEAA